MSHTTHPYDSQGDSPVRDGGDGVPSMGRTIRDGGSTMGHASPSILHNTKGHTSLPSILRNTMGRTIPSLHHSTKGHTIRDISMARNSMSTMGNNVCSSTTNFRCCKDRTSIRSCSRDRISSRKDFHQLSQQYLPVSDHI